MKIKKNYKIVISIMIIFLVSYNFKYIKTLIKENVSKENIRLYSRIINAFQYEEKLNTNDSIYYGLSKVINNKTISPEISNNILRYQIPKIFPGKYSKSINSGYIDFYKNGLIYASANGIFTYLEFNDDKKIKLNFLESNIDEFINYREFYTESYLGIKDIYIEKNIIYISFNYILDNKINNSIIYSEINNRLIFKKFFIPKKLIDFNNSYGEVNAHQSGGRITGYRGDSLLVSYGEFRIRDLAQSDSSINGKILAISKSNGGYKIKTKGHRNPQGLDYSQEKKIIISTEHGPAGGDEINLVRKVDNLENFGWPISSYGYHYANSNGLNDHSKGEDLIENSPLYKSHKEYGFTEPIYYFNESPGISEIKIINENENEILFVVGTMGWPNLKKHDRKYLKSLLFFKYNIQSDKIKLVHDILLNERVRDLVYNKKKGQLLILGETSGKLIIINDILNFYNL